MANVGLEYGPYNSKAGSERVYEAKDIGRMFDGIVTDGVFPYIGNKFRIDLDEGLKIRVNSGRAFFNHTWNYLESPILFKLENGDAMYDRYDAVILQIGCSELVRENQILVKTGTPAEIPRPPEVENVEDEKYEYVLGYIRVPRNANELTDPTLITNLVGADSDPLGFYRPGVFAEFAYAIGNNNIGVKRITVAYDPNDPTNYWEEMHSSDETHTAYYKRSNIDATGILDNAKLNMDLWTEGDNIPLIQKQENSFSFIYRHEIRDGKLTLYAYYRPDVEITLRFVGTGINNI